ncbi:16510_t:CDS:2 [Funneliformis mosseae]|uniref:16510_t:CDS:1 n=1 Tax=Funneliformis mosseae TaxID=27381 RepID=A0A9N8VLN0_FUNMO|nr:16510_t:CDS:2 [Funneliformis mosseae]
MELSSSKVNLLRILFCGRFINIVFKQNSYSEAKYNKPIFVNTNHVVRETDVQNALQTNVLFNLNVVLENDSIVFRSPSGSDMNGSGLSDFVAKKGDTTILIIEVKKILPIGRKSSIEFFQNDSKGKCVILQTFSYMVDNNLLYGIITMYDQNWFLQRKGDNRNQILISETLSFDNNNLTVLKAYAYLALRAKQNHYFLKPNLICIPNTTLQSRYLIHSITEDVEKRLDAIFKKLEVYCILKDIQGICIPKLVYYSYLLDRPYFIIGTTFVGKSLEKFKTITRMQEQRLIKR